MTLGVEATDLSMRYARTTALAGLGFTLAPGRIHGLLGRNGAGKTTLLSVIAGFLRPCGGQVLVGGRPVFENSQVTRHVCLVGESSFLGEPSDRVREVLSTARSLRRGWDARYATELVELFDLNTDAKMSELSRGKRSALISVVGLAGGAALTMFDEPSLGMDAPTRAAFGKALLAEFHRSGRTFVISTHLIEEASPLFEEVLIIDRGRLLLQEKTAVLRNSGCRVTGPVQAVESFAAGSRVLGTPQRLGNTSSVVLYGLSYEQERDRASHAGLELEPAPLQELFIHLTEPTEPTDSNEPTESNDVSGTGHEQEPSARGASSHG
ncbi:MAG: type transport system ATP-binding protein [Actinomycetota bacterium]|nr:type transport system ATP-binding protein [Actinomycetota bacterium]